MKRKIVQHGSSSLTITLPVKWVQKYSLKKGDELEVQEAGPILSISTEAEITSPKKMVSTTESGIFTKNNLSHLYQLGYDEIEIRFDDAKTLDEIKQRMPDCIGFEIIDQKPNRVYIKSIATTLETEFDTLLRKAFMITNEMAKAIVDAFEKANYGKLKEIRSMESLNNKFTDVCIRILNKKGYKAPKRTMQVYEIVKNIERIADEFKYVCDLKKKISKEELKSFKLAVDYYLAFYDMFYKFDARLKKKLYDERNSLVKIFSEQMEKSKNPLFMHHCINIVMKAFDGAGGYFALVL
jgi:phosphate uptake regulator